MNNRFYEFGAFLKLHNKKTISYKPIYARITGSTSAAVMLSQIMFYWGQGNVDDRTLEGSDFGKTDRKFMEDIHMSPKKFNYARNILRKSNIITIKKRGCPLRTFYKLHENILRSLISANKNIVRRQVGSPKMWNKDYIIHVMKKDISIHQHATGFFPSIKEIDRMIPFLCSLKIKGQAAIDRDNREKEKIEGRRSEVRQEVARTKRKSTKNDRSGYIYFLSSAGYVKIGKTLNLDDRMRSLEMSTPLEIELLHFVKSENIDKDERIFHNMFVTKRVKGEWFDLDERDIEEIKTK